MNLESLLKPLNLFKDKLKDRWTVLAIRERCLLSIGAVVVALALYYFIFYSPMDDAIDNLQNTIAENHSLYNWMQQASQDLKLSNSPAISEANKLPLLSLIEKTIQLYQLNDTTNEIKLLKENQVSIKFNNVSYEEVLKWLKELNKTYALSINKITLRAKDKPGMVEMDAVVSR